MVVSKLDPSISFLERNNIESSDENFSSPIYTMEIGDITVECVVGQIQTLPYSNKIVYCPIYLIYQSDKYSKSPSIIGKIGVYEMLSDTILQYRGENGNINVEALDEPLLFSFVDDNYLRSYQLHKDDWIKQTITFVDVEEKDKPNIEWSRKDTSYDSIYDALYTVHKDNFKSSSHIKEQLKQQELKELQLCKEYIENNSLSIQNKKNYIHKANDIVKRIHNIRKDNVIPLIPSISTLLKKEIYILEKGVDHDEIKVYESKPIIILYKEYNTYYIVYHKGYNK